MYSSYILQGFVANKRKHFIKIAKQQPDKSYLCIGTGKMRTVTFLRSIVLVVFLMECVAQVSELKAFLVDIA